MANSILKILYFDFYSKTNLSMKYTFLYLFYLFNIKEKIGMMHIGTYSYTETKRFYTRGTLRA